jgi:hypothetical protein
VCERARGEPVLDHQVGGMSCLIRILGRGHRRVGRRRRTVFRRRRASIFSGEGVRRELPRLGQDGGSTAQKRYGTSPTHQAPAAGCRRR